MKLKQLSKYSTVKGLGLAPIRRLAQKIAGENATIFMLHRFEDPSIGSTGHDPVFLRQCLEDLRRQKFNLVSVEQILTAAKNNQPLKNAVAFTVDDGYSDHASVGGKIFAEYDCPATFFLITDFIDNQFWPDDAKLSYILRNSPRKSVEWRKNGSTVHLQLGSLEQRKKAIRQVVWGLKPTPLDQLNERVQQLAQHAEVELPQQPPPLFAPMSWEDARRLEKKGMHLGAHTCRHAVLSAEDDETARAEITRSLDAVRAQVERASKVFCYPTGRYTDFGEREKGYVEDAGCVGAVSAEPGYFNPATQPDYGGNYSVPRPGFPGSYEDFQQRVLYIEYFKDLFRKKLHR